MSKAPTVAPALVRAARRGAGLTQTQAAALIGATLRTWQEWEGGRRNMPPAKWAYLLLMLRDAAPAPPQ